MLGHVNDYAIAQVNVAPHFVAFRVFVKRNLCTVECFDIIGGETASCDGFEMIQVTVAESKLITVLTLCC
jgi:hypothetical protein